MDRDALLERLRAHFAPSPLPLVAVWLFGSQARGDAREDSDVDVAVLFTEAPGDGYATLMLGLDLAAALETVLGAEVDVAVLNDAAPDLVHRVLRDGVLVLERERSARIAFEVRARNEYFDLVPVLQRYRRFAGDEP